MKIIRLISWLALTALLLLGCEREPIPDGSDTMRETMAKAMAMAGMNTYFLHISFKDASGNDLLEPLAYYTSDPDRRKYWGEVNPDDCTLRTIVSSWQYPEMTSFSLAKFDENHSWMSTDENGRYGDGGTWYFTINLCYPARPDGSPYSPLLYDIASKKVFGVSYFRRVTTWWEEGQLYPECIRATLGQPDNKEIIPVKGITYNEQGEPYYVGYFLDIVLD